MPVTKPIKRPCPACGAEPGEPCRRVPAYPRVPHGKEHHAERTKEPT